MEKSKSELIPNTYLESDNCLQEYLNSLTINDCKDSIKNLPLDIAKRMVIEQYLQKGLLKIEIFQKNICSGFGWAFSSQDSNFWTKVLLKNDFDLFYEKYPKSVKPLSKFEKLPIEIQEKMLDHQEEQGNPRNRNEFIKSIISNRGNKGFNWSRTELGHENWALILNNCDFDVFYKQYPKESLSQISSTHIKSELLDLLCECEKLKTDCSSKFPVTNISSLITDLEISVLKINTNNYLTNLTKLIN